MNSILEYHRLEKDIEELERNVNALDSTLRDRKNELEQMRTLIENIEGEVKDLRYLFDASKIWMEASFRIALQREQVNLKEADFRMMNSDREGRDLKRVEEDLSESSRKKDELNGTCSSTAFFG